MPKDYKLFLFTSVCSAVVWRILELPPSILLIGLFIANTILFLICMATYKSKIIYVIGLFAIYVLCNKSAYEFILMGVGFMRQKYLGTH